MVCSFAICAFTSSGKNVVCIPDSFSSAIASFSLATSSSGVAATIASTSGVSSVTDKNGSTAFDICPPASLNAVPTSSKSLPALTVPVTSSVCKILFDAASASSICAFADFNSSDAAANCFWLSATFVSANADCAVDTCSNAPATFACIEDSTPVTLPTPCKFQIINDATANPTSKNPTATAWCRENDTADTAIPEDIPFGSEIVAAGAATTRSSAGNRYGTSRSE